MSHHWKTTAENGISRGVFGSILGQDRFMPISRNLHFNHNSDLHATTDRVWKPYRVVTTLQQMFKAGYVAPAELFFDEAMLPSPSSFNITRVYLKGKHHK